MKRELGTPLTKKLILVALLALCLNPPAKAEGAGAHGGTGKVVGKQICLMDLYDNGACTTAVIDTTLKPRPEYRSRIVEALQDVWPADSRQIELISQKMTEIGNVSSAMAETLVRGMQLYFWSMPAVPLGLKDVHDDHSPFKGAEDGTVQLAVRDGRSIKFSGALMPATPDNLTPSVPIEHQVALVFHEIAYAFTMPSLKGAGLVQDSKHAKDFTGFIFKRMLKSSDMATLKSMAGWLGLPTWQIKSYREIGEGGSDPTFQANPELSFITMNGGDTGWFATYTPDSGLQCVGPNCVATDVASWCKGAMSPIPYRLTEAFQSRQVHIQFVSYNEINPTNGGTQTGEYLSALEAIAKGVPAGGFELQKHDYELRGDNCAPYSNNSIERSQAAFAKYTKY